MAGPFYFAWVGAADNTWSPAFAREDEDVFGFTMNHGEGDFPFLELTVRNPRVGLLASSRQQWAWLSYQGEGMADPVPVFYGRIVGVPQALQAELVRLSFVARPSDYEEQRAALADSLRVLPWYDPIWLSEEDREDPDRVLEARTELWHIDRVTHEVTTSDILAGDNLNTDAEPTAILSPFDAVYDSLDVSYNTSPARRVDLVAEISWRQQGGGELDLTQDILEAFREITPEQVAFFDGRSFNTAGQILTIGGEELQAAWPDPERNIGGGWRVGASELQLIGQPPGLPTGYAADVYQMLRDADPTNGSLMNRADGLYQTVRDLVGRTPGYVVQVVHHSIEEEDADNQDNPPQIDVVWIPIWRMAPTYNVAWKADRQRTETMTFSMEADVQPLLADPGDEEVITLGFGPAYVDEEIPNPLMRSYFKTERGQQSAEHLLARARAALLARSRAINISAVTTFDFALGLSCRMSLAIQDDRLPGGIAAGKVTSYRLSADGSTGEVYGAVTIGCTVGRSGTVTPETGEPSYVDEGYVNPGYQFYAGAVRLQLAGDVTIAGIEDTPIDDDGQNLLDVTKLSHLLDVGASGGLETQEARLNVNSVNPNAIHVVDRVNSVRIDVWSEMRPVTGGPFLTEFFPSVSALAVPRTIDLEAE